MKYHSYVFFAVDKTIQLLSQKELDTYKKEFIEKVSEPQHIITYTYTLLGLKGKNACMFWMQSESIENLQDFLNTLLHTPLGKYLLINGTLLGMARPSQYSRSANNLNTERKGGKYLIVYPFTKTTEWYVLDFEKRKELMKGHINIGRNYPRISQILLYSIGIDDNEFIVSYETDDLSEFQQLVMDLRADAVRAYTLKDTPIFTCIYRSIEDTLNFL